MRTVHKYPLRDLTVQNVSMPAGAKIVHVDRQFDLICLWAEVHTEAPLAERTVYILGTGQMVPPEVHVLHQGTVKDGLFVWHVYA